MQVSRAVLLRRRRQSGQIGLIIILIMIVLLTIGLSLAAQSSREVILSQQEEESTRVFNAAEAGIEQALSTNLSFQGEELHPAPTTLPGTNATVDYTIRKVRTLETRLFQGVSAHLQLKDEANNPTVASVTIDWSKDTDCNAGSNAPGSLIVSVFSRSGSTDSVRHFAYGACPRGDGMTISGAGTNGYFRSTTLAVGPNDMFLRIKPVYNDAHVRVTGSGGTGQLPVQYYNIVSSATNQQGQENRVVEVNRTLSVAPALMDYVLFTGASLTK